jgi:hypothetical protein
MSIRYANSTLSDHFVRFSDCSTQDQDNEYGSDEIYDLGCEIIAAARKKEEKDLAEELITELGNELFWVRKGYVEPKTEIIQKINV